MLLDVRSASIFANAAFDSLCPSFAFSVGVSAVQISTQETDSNIFVLSEQDDVMSKYSFSSSFNC